MTTTNSNPNPRHSLLSAILLGIIFAFYVLMALTSCNKDQPTKDEIYLSNKPIPPVDMISIERYAALNVNRSLAKTILFLQSMTMDNVMISSNKVWHKLNGHKLVRIILTDSGEGVVNFGGVILRSYNTQFQWIDGTITYMAVLSLDRGLNYTHELATNSKGYLHVNHVAKLVRMSRETGVQQSFFNIDRDQNGSTSRYKVDYSLNGTTYIYKTRLDLQPNVSNSNLYLVIHNY